MPEPAEQLRAAAQRLQGLLEGATEEWAVMYAGSIHYRVSGSTQALQLAASARGRGSDVYAAHRLLPAWRRMELDHG